MALEQLLAEDKLAIILGEDLHDPYGGAFKVTKGLSSKYPDRVISTPISEQAITGIAVGCALRNVPVIVEIMFGDFITLSCDQIVNHAVKFYSMYGAKLEMPFILRTPMGAGRGYGPTHSQSLEKLYLGLHDLLIVAPSLFHCPGTSLKEALALKRPTLFIENKILYPQHIVLDELGQLNVQMIDTDGHFKAAWVKNFKGQQRPDVTLISYGGSSLNIKNCLEKLADDEIWTQAFFIQELQLPSLNFLKEMISSEPVLIVEEMTDTFSWGTQIELFLRKQLKLQKVETVSSVNSFIPANHLKEQQMLPSEEKILNKIFEILL